MTAGSEPDASTAAPDRGARVDGWTYRPHLDGLRAVAVYLVVAFHAGIGRLQGGFIGVDVFFVLSGYLVTGVLARDTDGPTGRVRFGRFYARRVRRLLPAAAVNLVVAALVFRAVAEPALFEDGWRSIRAAALYVSNWFFIRESADYFGSDITASPVAHYWSLSVEEQFYLVWPVVFAGLTIVSRRFGPRGLSVRWAVIAGLAIASLALALGLTSADDPRPGLLRHRHSGLPTARRGPGGALAQRARADPSFASGRGDAGRVGAGPGRPHRCFDQPVRSRTGRARCGGGRARRRGARQPRVGRRRPRPPGAVVAPDRVSGSHLLRHVLVALDRRRRPGTDMGAVAGRYGAGNREGSRPASRP